MKDPNFDIAFTIGSFTIYWYAILMAVGIGAALMITDRRTKGRDLPKDIALDLCILGLPCGILGARVFACISGEVTGSAFFDLSKPGLSFFGGVIFAAAAIVAYLKIKRASLEEMMDAAAPGVFAGIGIAVWGDFFNRSHYGPLVQKASLKWFPLATFGNDLKVHYAAFFYEFLLCAALIVVYYAVLRKKVQKKSCRFLLMALVYCVGRFAIDSIRQDLVMAGPVAFDQLCEILLIVLCLILLFLKRPWNAALEATEKTEEKAEAGEEPQPEPAETAEEPEVEEKDEEEASEEPAEAAEKEATFTGLN